jgi:hypothetical protein
VIAMRGRQKEWFCLYPETKGHEWMHDYDELPPDVREYLQHTNHDLCPWCVRNHFLKAAHGDWFLAVDLMEQMAGERDERENAK